MENSTLHAKEGIVLDAEGNVLSGGESSSRAGTHVRFGQGAQFSWSRKIPMTGWPAILLGLLLPVFFVIAVIVLITALALGAAYMLVRFLLQMLGLRK